MGYAVGPRSERTPLIVGPQAQPQRGVNFLNKVSTAVRIGLVRDGESIKCRAELLSTGLVQFERHGFFGSRLHIQIVGGNCDFVTSREDQIVRNWPVLGVAVRSAKVLI